MTVESVIGLGATAPRADRFISFLNKLGGEVKDGEFARKVGISPTIVEIKGLLINKPVPDEVRIFLKQVETTERAWLRQKSKVTGLRDLSRITAIIGPIVSGGNQGIHGFSLKKLSPRQPQELGLNCYYVAPSSETRGALSPDGIKTPNEIHLWETRIPGVFFASSVPENGAGSTEWLVYVPEPKRKELKMKHTNDAGPIKLR